jgi:hypothetical protein
MKLYFLIFLFCFSHGFAGRKFMASFDGTHANMQAKNFDGFDLVTNRNGGGFERVAGRTGYAMGIAANNSFWSNVTYTGLTGTDTCYLRVWFEFKTNAYHEANTQHIVELSNVGNTQGIAIAALTNGKLVFQVNGTNIDTTTNALTLNSFYIIKIKSKWAASGSVHTCQIGTEQMKTSNINMSENFPTRLFLGWAGATNTTAYHVAFDDLAINDSQGSSENSFPDDSGKIVAMIPVSDNSRGGWTGGGGSTTNTYLGLIKIHPLGFCVSTPYVEYDSTQIKNSVSSSTDNYDVNIQSYSTVGVAANDTILLVQSLARTGEHATANIKAGAVALLSNPTDAGETSFSFGHDEGMHTFDDNGVASSGIWRNAYGAIVYRPSVTLGTSPVARVGKRTATTDQVCVDFLGVLMEYKTGINVSNKRIRINE